MPHLALECVPLRLCILVLDPEPRRRPLRHADLLLRLTVVVHLVVKELLLLLDLLLLHPHFCLDTRQLLKMKKWQCSL